MLTIEADIYEYVRMSYVDKNILGPLVHMYIRKTHSKMHTAMGPSYVCKCNI